MIGRKSVTACFSGRFFINFHDFKKRSFFSAGVLTNSTQILRYDTKYIRLVAFCYCGVLRYNIFPLLMTVDFPHWLTILSCVLSDSRLAKNWSCARIPQQFPCYFHSVCRRGGCCSPASSWRFKLEGSIAILTEGALLCSGERTCVRIQRSRSFFLQNVLKIEVAWYSMWLDPSLFLELGAFTFNTGKMEREHHFQARGKPCIGSLFSL